jgi:hypothetical protein
MIQQKLCHLILGIVFCFLPRKNTLFRKPADDMRYQEPSQSTLGVSDLEFGGLELGLKFCKR